MRKIRLISAIASFLSGCISLNKASEKQEKLTSDAIFKDFNIEVFSNSDADKTCFHEDQIIFLKQALSKYFSGKKTEDNKIKLVFSRTSSSESIILSLNAILSIATYTVIPMYKSEDYKIEVFFDNGQYLSDEINDESLYSILVLPFMINKNIKSIRRDNIEGLIQRLSTSDSLKKEFSLKNIEEAKLCSGFRDYFIDQRW